MATLSVVFGTYPRLQFVPVFQSLFVAPVQVIAVKVNIHPGLDGGLVVLPPLFLLKAAVMLFPVIVLSWMNASVIDCTPLGKLNVHGDPEEVLIRLIRLLAIPMIVRVPSTVCTVPAVNWTVFPVVVELRFWNVVFPARVDTVPAETNV